MSNFPEGSFISQYLDYMSVLETPRDFDLWASLWCLSVTLGRRLLVDRPRIPVFLNQYLIFCGQSGIVRKSTSVNYANKVVEKFSALHPERRILNVTAKTTPEMFEWKMAMHSQEFGETQAAVSISELVRFLGRERYLSAMPGLLTDLYDCPSQMRSPGTFARGEYTLNRVYLSFLGASTPSWLIRAMHPNVVEGGFTSRVLFIYCEEPKLRAAWPSDTPTTSDDLARKLSLIYQESKDVRSITLSNPARERYEEWYNTREREYDDFRASFQSREDEHILRMAALLSANDHSWQISDSHLSYAIREVLRCRENGAKLFEFHLTYDRLALGIDRLRKHLEEYGSAGVSQTELYRRLRHYFSKERFDAVLSVLHELGMVTKSILPPESGRGRPATFWQVTKRIRSASFYEDIIGKIQPEAMIK